MTRRAFTLVELAVVIAILAILSAIAIPRFASASARRALDASAQRIVADLRHARQHALATSAPVAVTFDADTDSYVVAAPSPLGNATSYRVDLSDPPLSCRISATTLASSIVTFSAHGLPANSGDVTIQAGRFSRTISISAGVPAPAVAAPAEKN